MITILNVRQSSLFLLVFPNDKKILEMAIYGNLAQKNSKGVKEEGIPFEEYIKRGDSMISESRKSTIMNMIEKMKMKEEIKSKKELLDFDFEIMDLEEDLDRGFSGSIYNESSQIERNIEDFELIEEKIETSTSSIFNSFFEADNIVIFKLSTINFLFSKYQGDRDKDYITKVNIEKAKESEYIQKVKDGEIDPLDITENHKFPRKFEDFTKEDYYLALEASRDYIEEAQRGNEPSSFKEIGAMGMEDDAKAGKVFTFIL